MIAQKLPEITSTVDNAIKSSGHDPWPNVASGHDSPGSYCVHIPIVGKECVSAGAKYSLKNMTGLSTLDLDSVVITSVSNVDNALSKISFEGQGDDDKSDFLQAVGHAPDAASGSSLTGVVAVKAHLKSSLKLDVSGSVYASIAGLHPSVGLGGSVTVDGVSASGSGTAGISMSGGQVCLNSVSINTLNLQEANISVHLNGLGVFGGLLSSVVTLIVNLFKSTITSQIAPLVRDQLEDAVKGQLPLCGDM
ncbi:MAG: hypothetical protein NXI16_11675 [Alphaproteobacteria bacterium]|nr:hypothetical protein [Alphaproteobacteria bacterium]